MKNSHLFSTAADESYRILTQAKGHVSGSPCSTSATGQTGSAGSSRNVSVHNSRCSLVFLFVVSMLALLAVTGCSDSDSDPSLVLEDAQWVAFQDGDGEWQEIEVPEDLIFTPEVNDPDGEYGLAILIASADNQSVQIITLQTTTDEIPSLNFSSLLDQEDTSLEVTVAESSTFGDNSVDLYVGDEDEYVRGTTPETFYPNTTPYDLVATLTTGGLNYPTQMIVREFDSSGQETVDIDFDTDEDVVDLSGPQTFSYNPVIDLGENASMDYFEVYLRTANNTLASLGHEHTEDGATSVDYTYPADLTSAVPDANYLLELDIDLDEHSSLFYSEGFSIHGAQVLDFPDPFDGQCVSDTATGSILPGMTWTGTYDDAIAFVNYFTGEAGGIDYSTTSIVTAGRQGTNTSMTMPDLSSADTWYSLWSIPTNAQASEERAVAVMSSESIADLSTSDLSYLYFTDGPALEDGAWIAAFSNFWYAEGSDPL